MAKNKNGGIGHEKDIQKPENEYDDHGIYGARNGSLHTAVIRDRKQQHGECHARYGDE